MFLATTWDTSVCGCAMRVCLVQGRAVREGRALRGAGYGAGGSRFAPPERQFVPLPTPFTLPLRRKESFSGPATWAMVGPMFDAAVEIGIATFLANGDRGR